MVQEKESSVGRHRIAAVRPIVVGPLRKNPAVCQLRSTVLASRVAIFLCLFLSAVGVGCNAPQPASAPAESPAPRPDRGETRSERRAERREERREERRQAGEDQGSQAPAASAPGSPHDLSQDEAAGGHTLKKHVGRTDDQLRERLQDEPRISAASTWTDRATAEQAVGTALAQNQDRINRWLDRSGNRPNLVLDYAGDNPVGRTLRRGADQAEPCSHAMLVLKWAGDRNYYVLTTYPECRS
jgi:Bacterial CdiA-CT RNAse A domain